MARRVTRDPHELARQRDNEIARRVCWVVGQAEIALGLEHDAAMPLDVALDRVLAGALAGRLDPGIYALCWAWRGIPAGR